MGVPSRIRQFWNFFVWFLNREFYFFLALQITWVDCRLFTYFAEEFLAQVSKISTLFFSGICQNSLGREGFLLFNPHDKPHNPLGGGGGGGEHINTSRCIICSDLSLSNKVHNNCSLLTFTPLWANSEDDKLMLFYFSYFTLHTHTPPPPSPPTPTKKKRIWRFMLIVSICTNVQTCFGVKIRNIFQYVVCWKFYLES